MHDLLHVDILNGVQQLAHDFQLCDSIHACRQRIAQVRLSGIFQHDALSQALNFLKSLGRNDVGVLQRREDIIFLAQSFLIHFLLPVFFFQSFQHQPLPISVRLYKDIAPGGGNLLKIGKGDIQRRIFIAKLKVRC